jgi:hypothetical protein
MAADFMGSLVRSVFRWGKAVLDGLVDLLVLPGTNGLGLALVLAVFVPLGMARARFPSIAEGVLIGAGGAISLLLDLGLRRALRHESLMEYHRGGRLVYLPVWIWGVLWLLVGAILAVATLLAE